MKILKNIGLSVLLLLMGSSLILLQACKDDDETVTPIDETIKDADGNVYHTIKIGTQTWMLENLKATKYRDGSAILNITDNNEWAGAGNLGTSAYCDYENNSSNSTTYGRLYNWYAVTDSRNLCPIGWHVPTDAEWTSLINYLGGDDVAGGKLKEAGSSHWLPPNQGANNSSGFTALPGGSRQIITGTFGGLREGASFWSQTSFNEELAFYRQLYYDQNTVGKIGFGKASGYSVRCIKD